MDEPAAARQGLRRRQVLAWGLALAPGVGAAQAPPASVYPQRSVRLVCPTAPGSSPDLLARLVAQQLSLQLGQAVLVENQPGAGTTRATGAVANAAADGYTLLATFSPTFAMSALRYKSVRYQAQQSFTALGRFASITPFLVVHTALPARTPAAYVQLAKTTPQRLEFATSGAAGMPLLLAQSLAQAAGIDLLFVPYGSEAESRQDVVSGRVSTAVFWAPVTLQLVRAGQVRALAYAGSQRHPDLARRAHLCRAGLCPVAVSAADAAVGTRRCARGRGAAHQQRAGQRHAHARSARAAAGHGHRAQLWRRRVYCRFDHPRHSALWRLGRAAQPLV
jgi:tripartite-type tricarboxylate transporter receptor subunit TctC